MKPLRLLVCLLFLSTLAFAQHKTAPPKKKLPPAKTVAPWEAIHQSALIIDTHADTPQRFLDENFDLSQNTPIADGHIDFGKIKKGNLGAEFFSISVAPRFKGHYPPRAINLIQIMS